MDAKTRDRAHGVLLGTAAGDALGAPFEFGPPVPETTPVEMTGGGPWEKGEWTDDTAMALAIAEVAAAGADLREESAQDAVVHRWAEWARTAKDVGIQTRRVLAAISPDAPAAGTRQAAEALHRSNGRSGGNGALMRTAPVALAFLGDPEGIIGAAIAGGLLGAGCGASAVPAHWRRVLHGWPGLNTRGVNELSAAILRHGEPDTFDYGYRGQRDHGVEARQHPHDAGVWIGGIQALRTKPAEVNAVVSLCRVGDADLPADAELTEVWLIDNETDNADLDFVLEDTVALIRELRAEGRTVLLHCVAAHSRTPTVAALYGAKKAGISAAQALRDVQNVLPKAHPNAAFRAVIGR